MEIKLLPFYLPAGHYRVVDPCYIFRDNWSDICGALDISDEFEEISAFMQIDGEMIYLFTTPYGDGTYKVRFGNQSENIDVDSGLIAIIPEHLCTGTDGMKIYSKRIIKLNEHTTISIEFSNGLRINFEN